MAYPYLTRLVQEGNLVSAKQAIDSIVASDRGESKKRNFKSRYQYRDQILGLSDDHPVQIDVGPFQKGCEKELWEWGEKRRASHLRRFSSWLRALCIS